jgi:hypothetical protein
MKKPPNFKLWLEVSGWPAFADIRLPTGDDITKFVSHLRGPEEIMAAGLAFGAGFRRAEIGALPADILLPTDRMKHSRGAVLLRLDGYVIVTHRRTSRNSHLRFALTIVLPRSFPNSSVARCIGRLGMRACVICRRQLVERTRSSGYVKSGWAFWDQVLAHPIIASQAIHACRAIQGIARWLR